MARVDHLGAIDHRRPAAWDAEGRTHVSSVRGVPGTVRGGLDRLEVFLDHDAGDERCATPGGHVDVATNGFLLKSLPSGYTCRP